MFSLFPKYSLKSVDSGRERGRCSSNDKYKVLQTILLEHSHPGLLTNIYFTTSKLILSILPSYFTTHLTSQFLFLHTTY